MFLRPARAPRRSAYVEAWHCTGDHRWLSRPDERPVHRDAGRRAAGRRRDHPQRAVYTEASKEYYLTQAQADFVKPGIVYKINSVTIGADRKPVIDVTITDSLGTPVDRNGIQTPGTVSATFVLSWYDPATRNYTSYATRTATGAPPAAPEFIGKTAIQAAGLSGTIVDVELGHFKFNSSTVLPSGFDQTKTHTLAVYGRRTMPDFIPVIGGKDYIDNAELDFRPDGQPVTVKWDEIQEKNACNQCHGPLSAHGDVRQDAKLCVLCHSPQTTDPDTGNLLDMRLFIHKIHRGESLPSVQAGKPYLIIGNSQSVNDYSDVVFPQDIRNCQNCHEGRIPANKPSQSDVWYTKPARVPCGACHDDIDWVTGANHPGGPQANDSACASCHVPAGRPGVGRRDQDRAHGPLPLQAVEGPERDDPLRDQHRAGQEADRHLQDDRERRQDSRPEDPWARAPA